jgi:molybdopterin/thiamine biosynthesis adenylyltransferase
MNHHASARDQLLKPRLPENASVKLIGLGGVGSIVARYLFTFLASLGQDARFVLIDGDSFDFGNVSRMIFGACGNKAAVIRDELSARLADSPLSVESIEEYVTPENVSQLIHNGNIVLLTVDNHATRKLVDDRCASLDQCCLISGGNDGIGKDASGRVRRGTFGNVQIYVREDGVDLTPSLACHHPEIAKPADVLPTDQSCHELAMSVPQILFMNLTVAAAILNTLFLHLSGALHYGELAFDIAEGKMRPVMLPSEIPKMAQNRAR